MIVPLKADYNPAGDGFETADAGDFNYSKKITLDHDQVPGDLSGFPVLINITDDSDMFSHCVNDSGYDVAFFSADNNTQFPHEIEYWNWDDGNSEVDAYIWVNVSSVTGASDTVLYMYYGYDNSNQQDIENVWDGNYTLVYHLSETTGTIYDSTSNDNDGTPTNGVSMDETVQVDGGVDFDGSDDFINVSHSDSIDFDENDQLTISFWCKNVDLGDASDHMAWFTKRGGTSEGYKVRFTYNHATFEHQFTDTEGNEKNRLTAFETIDNNLLHQCVVSFDGSDEAVNIKLYINGVQVDDSSSENDSLGTVKNTGTLQIGARAFGTDDQCNGSLDEVRISNIQRSSNWIVTSYNTIVNGTNGNFFTLGPEHEVEDGGDSSSTYSLKGLTSSKITWAGVAGNTVYCNDTGDGNEWVEINMSINASQNVTEIRVFMDDLNDTGDDIGASAITLYVSSDNSSYGTLGAYSNGGSNKTINATTWPGGAGTNPFTAGAGLTDCNKSIWCIFTLAIPIGAPTDFFYSEASDSCKVYIGHYT